MTQEKQIVEPEYLNSSIGVVMKYSFTTINELEQFFLAVLAFIQKKKLKTKVIGNSLYVFRGPLNN